MRLQAEYKQTYKLRSTEEAFAALEDNTVMLSTMKASKFFLVFEKDITKWEQTLSLVSEMIEMIQQVQKNWQYLESIFVGSEDIRKQLPQESVMFDVVHQTFMDRMAQLRGLRNIVKACTHPGMLDAFNDMDAKLEKIQKSLENYLEAKRQQFPRFYFLSSDDLLEILGQAKDPMNVQSHLKKCFEGIKKLEMYPPGSDSRRQWESVSVESPDGCAHCQTLTALTTGYSSALTGATTGGVLHAPAAQYALYAAVPLSSHNRRHMHCTRRTRDEINRAACRERLPFKAPVVTAGRPEEWLNDVEAAMFAATKFTLFNVLEAAKATKKEKWVKENQGQCIITAGQIIWTVECEAALSDAETARKAVRQLKKKWVSYLNKLTAITRSKINKIERNKTVSLITIEVR